MTDKRTPREPTPEMIAAASALCSIPIVEAFWADAWRTMHDAALIASKFEEMGTT